MNDAPQKPSDEPADDLAALFGRVGARERPRGAAEAAAFAALHAEWRNVTAARRRRRHDRCGSRRGRIARRAVARLPLAADARSGPPAAARDDRARRRRRRHLARRSFASATARRSGATSPKASALRPVPRSRVAPALARRRLAAARRALAARVRVDRRRATHGRQPLLRLGRRHATSRRSGAGARRADAGRRGRAHRHAIHGDRRGDEVVLSVREGQVKVTGDGFELVVDTNEELDLRADGARERDRDRRARRPLDVGRRRRAADRARRPYDVRRRRVGRARDRPPRRLRRRPAESSARRRCLARHRSPQPPNGILTLLPISRALPTRFATTRSSCRRREPFAARGRAACVASRALGALAEDASVGRPIAPSSTRCAPPACRSPTARALLPPSLTVRAPPHAHEPVELVREILAPHGLTLRFVEGLYIVVRAAETSTAAATTGTVTITVRDAETGALIASPTTGDSLERARRRNAARRPAARLSGTAQRRYGVTLDGRRLCAAADLAADRGRAA